jgi:acyl-CoA thioester hydrolase
MQPEMGQPAVGQPAMGQPAPHIVEIEVLASDIDAYQHVNNSVYLSWLDRAAWSHSAKLGVPLEQCISMRRGMAAHRSEIDYLRAAVLGDRVIVGTWILSTDHRLRVERRFEVRRAPQGELLARARIDYVCINLDSGRATRMPDLFRRAYVPAPPNPGVNRA